MLPPEDPPLSANNEPHPGLSLEEERVYDLSEFGAVRVSDSPQEAEQGDRVYDLAEFGAVGLD